ncbi:MAG: hypothetical protein XD94_1856 [Mesotoga prima]|uniref:Uncharacterized protein n=1 Tax=Mesotoga prima TaxID=1184387 RepID=A0A124FXH9_9BACT|nr:MAG: hypothetical protein XD94_1856 [Mesotoga prima]
MNREVHIRFFQRIADLQETVTFGGQFRFVGKTKTIEKESIERFATLTREEREGSQSADVGFF